MQKKIILWCSVIVLNSGLLSAQAGDLNPPSPDPDDPAGALYTLEDIYQRLLNGALGVLRGAGFVEPTGEPGSTGHTLNDLMSIAPTEDNTDGALPSEVLDGKTYWGLRTDGAWGLQTGTLATQTIDNSTVNQTAGNYAEFDLSDPADGGDSDLIASNLASGVDIFGVLGTALIAVGNAVENQVLAGATFSTSAGVNLTGTMPDSSTDITPSAVDQTIPQGYHDGTRKVAGDEDLLSGNIISGVDLFGVMGSALVAAGNAVTDQVLAGATFSTSAGVNLTGTMPDSSTDITPSAVDQAIPQGYHDGTGKVAGDEDLLSGNIISGVDLFGVMGSALVAAGNAVTDQVLAGATFSTSAGVSLTGTMPDSSTDITPSAVDQTIPQGYHDGTGKVAGDADLLAVNIKKDVEVFGVTGTAEVRGVPCPCFGLSLARAVIRELQPGITPGVESSEYCISQPGIFGTVHAGFSDASPLNTNFGVIQSSVYLSGEFKCQIFWRHVNLLKTFTFNVTPDEVAACRAVMADAIALEDTNSRCNINHIP